MAASAFFPGSCAITFPRAVLNEHGTRDDLRPKQSAERLPRDLLRLFSWPRRRNVPSLSALPACRPPRRNRPKSGASGERPVFRPSPLRAHAPRRALSPFLVQVPFLTQPRSSAAARAQNEAPYKMRRAPPSAAGKSRMRGTLGIEPESPPLPGEPDADPNRPLFSGVCLVRRNAQRTKPNP